MTPEEISNYIDTQLPSNAEILISKLRQVLKYLIINNSGGGGGEGGRFGIEDILTAEGQNRIIDMGANSFTLNNLREFRLGGYTGTTFVEGSGQYFPDATGLGIPEANGKALITFGGPKIPDVDGDLRVIILYDDASSHEFMFSPLEFSPGSWVYLYTPAQPSTSTLYGYYAPTQLPPDLKIPFYPASTYNGETILVVGFDGETVYRTTAPGSGGSNDTLQDVMTRGSESAVNTDINIICTKGDDGVPAFISLIVGTDETDYKTELDVSNGAIQLTAFNHNATSQEIYTAFHVVKPPINFDPLHRGFRCYGGLISYAFNTDNTLIEADPVDTANLIPDMNTVRLLIAASGGGGGNIQQIYDASSNTIVQNVNGKTIGFINLGDNDSDAIVIIQSLDDSQTMGATIRAQTLAPVGGVIHSSILLSIDPVQVSIELKDEGINIKDDDHQLGMRYVNDYSENQVDDDNAIPSVKAVKALITSGGGGGGIPSAQQVFEPDPTVFLTGNTDKEIGLTSNNDLAGTNGFVAINGNGNVSIGGTGNVSFITAGLAPLVNNNPIVVTVNDIAPDISGNVYVSLFDIINYNGVASLEDRAFGIGVINTSTSEGSTFQMVGGETNISASESLILGSDEIIIISANTPIYGVNKHLIGTINGVTADAQGNIEIPKIKVGTSALTLDGTTTVFNIPHGLGANPDSISLTFADGSNVPLNTSTRTFSSTNITITCPTPPAAGTSTVYWQVYKN